MVNVSRRTVLQAALVAAAAGVSRVSSAADVGPPGVGPLRTLKVLPPTDNQLALTVDDGISADVVSAYTDFCRDTGTRLTFFVNGRNDSWTVNAEKLRPMVDSGQIQLANHTWSHPDLTAMETDQIVDQILRNADFLSNTYGVDGRPYLRPPYGHVNADVERIATELGYPMIVLWSASLEDYNMLTEDELTAKVESSFWPSKIVLAHANFPTVVDCFPRMADIIQTRGLETVTLRDVFG